MAGLGLYLRISVDLPDHPKFIKAGPAAAWFWQAGLGYSKKHKLDGFIPAEKLATLVPGVNLSQAKKYAATLVEARLWLKSEGGFTVNDYLHYNPSRAELETDAERKRREYQERKKSGDGGGETTGDSGGETNREQSGEKEGDARLRDHAHGSGSDSGVGSALVSSSSDDQGDLRIATLRAIVLGLPEADRVDAHRFHRVIEQGLRRAGLDVQREVQILDRGPSHSGYIDLVIGGQPQIAVELDWRTPRGRSISKLLAFDGLRVVVLREAHEITQQIDGIFYICCAELPEATSGRRTAPARGGGLITSPMAHWRIHGQHVSEFCEWGVCLPNSVFDGFVRRVFAVSKDEGQAREQVLAWARDVRQRWVDRGEIPGSSIFKFWDNEWEATHGSNKPAVGGGDFMAGLKQVVRDGQ